MKNYNNWAQKWKSQQPASQNAPEILSSVKKGHLWTIIILSLTVAILIAFMIYTINPDQIVYSLGLGLMILSVIIRILLEIFSIKQLADLNVDSSLVEHLKQILSYHRKRLTIHQWWTPAILIAYWTGFVLLIPTFKMYLSDFMFQYVCWSSIPIAGLMIWFIIAQIKKEKAHLDKVIEEHSEI